MKHSIVITTEPCFENSVELNYFRDLAQGLCWLYWFTINLLSSSPAGFLFYSVFLPSSFPNHCTVCYRIINSCATEVVSTRNYPHPAVFQRESLKDVKRSNSANLARIQSEILQKPWLSSKTKVKRSSYTSNELLTQDDIRVGGAAPPFLCLHGIYRHDFSF
jgi:hypothetical protein